MDLDTALGIGRQSATEGVVRRALQADHGSMGGAGDGIDRGSELYKACVDFEAIFLKQMLAAMRKTVPKGGLLDGGIGRDVFEDMLYDEYAQSMARNAGFGLADTVYRHLTAVQADALGM